MTLILLQCAGTWVIQHSQCLAVLTVTRNAYIETHAWTAISVSGLGATPGYMPVETKSGSLEGSVRQGHYVPTVSIAG